MMRRAWIAVAVLIVTAVAATVPVVSRYRLQKQLSDAIDRCAPDSSAEIAALVGQGLDIRTRGSAGDTVAMVASFWNDSRLLQAAIDAGVDPNVADSSFGNTALIQAMFAPSAEPTRILLKAGAKVNHQCKTGDTALMYAVRNAQYDIIPLLLEAGAQVGLQNEKGETALTIAAALQPGEPRPMRPDLTAQDFVRLLEGAKGK
jgi:uncharacterized protein